MKMGKTRVLTILLIASIGLNIAGAAFVGAQWYRYNVKSARSGELTFDRRAALSSLEKSEKKQIRAIWNYHKPYFKDEVRDFREAKRILSDSLSAENLDDTEIKEAFDVLISSRQNVEKRLFTILYESARLLPPEKRETFFNRGFKRWSDRHHKFKDHKFGDKDD
ncbi:periplasmic heavy metal sensor [Sneathiella sp. P13V-1]|uniref:periplasmic heavy metal sensor n=1 Tax=Sneathiella sp. P13V-1 TaxID=2697366 RepID=UPI00187B801A|nr:periplasmic heavy metal sensor [Sneathiella sp. P13V-1]MBE7635490.1 periplasmic heavy metal sensor [Sneathiella sp. P13V-1]